MSAAQVVGRPRLDPRRSTRETTVVHLASPNQTGDMGDVIKDWDKHYQEEGHDQTKQSRVRAVKMRIRDDMGPGHKICRAIPKARTENLKNI